MSVVFRHRMISVLKPHSPGEWGLGVVFADYNGENCLWLLSKCCGSPVVARKVADYACNGCNSKVRLPENTLVGARLIDTAKLAGIVGIAYELSEDQIAQVEVIVS